MPTEELFAAQVQLLMRNLSSGLVFAQVSGVVVAIVLMWKVSHPLHLLAWVCSLFTLLMVRSWHMRRALRLKLYERDARALCWQLIAGLCLTGLAWVVAYIHVASFSPPSVQFLFLLIIVLIAALALGASVVVREYYIAYILSSLWPIAWWSLVNYWQLPYNAVVGLMLLLASGVLILVGNSTYESYRSMLQLNWEKDQLAEDLQSRNAELDQAHSRLSELANTDGLTGLPNRRSLNDQLELELRRADRDKRTLSAIMIDVDFFKNYNDNYGHPAGDVVLQAVADVLRDTVNRAADFVARYGGEEFMILLPGTHALAARAVAVRIQDALSRQAILHEYSPIAPVVTVSQGLAVARPEEKLSSRQLVTRADRGLYAAKKSGRDSIKAA